MSASASVSEPGRICLFHLPHLCSLPAIYANTYDVSLIYVTGSFPKPAEISNSDLDFMEKVGSGGAGSVWKGQWISKKKIVAVKILTDIDEREVSDVHM